jgi:hypothetical protein
MRTIKMNRNILAAIALLLVVGSCSYEFPVPPEETVGQLESADISKTVFVGGTLLSGVHNGALTTEFAQYSLPQVFLNHFEGNSSANWQNFSPAVESANGFNIYENTLLSETVGQYDLFYPTADTTDFKRTTTEGEAFAYSNAGGEILNFSFPKAQLLDLTETNTSNPFIASFNVGNTSVVQAAVAQDPTFFVLNLGYEDVLAYAMKGAEGAASLTDASNYNPGDMPSVALFESKFNEVVDAFLQANPNTKGAVFNLPDLLKLPYFIELRFDLTPYVKGTPKLNRIRSEASQYNQSLDNYYRQNPNIPFEDRRPYLDFAADREFNWGILVIDEDLPEAYYSNGQPIPKVRHLKREERVFYPAENFLRTTKGHLPGNALSEEEYLKEEDIELITNRIAAYNQIIANKVAQSNGRLALIDTHAYYEKLYEGLNLLLNRKPNGVDIEGVNFFPGISKFGIFSADGLNLNPRGNALMTSILIETLETTFGGDLKNVDPNAYKGTPIRAATSGN